MVVIPLVFSAILAISPQAATTCGAEGRVVDQQGAALPGVTVQLAEPPGTMVVTGPHGRFCLALPADNTRRTLVVSLPGFGAERRPAARHVADIVLRPSFAEDVTVTATRTRRLTNAVPVRTEVVSQDSMAASGARTLADAIEFTSGVRIENNCQNCNFSQIRLLGLEGPYTQILIDGQPVVSSLAQVYGIEHIPARMIERIEVVKGGGSALYGSGAVGGVINIIPREAPTRGGVIEFRRERGFSFNTAGDWISRSKRTTVMAFAQRDVVDPQDLDGDGFTEISRRRLSAGGVRANHFLLGGHAKLTGDLQVFHEDRRGGDALDLPPHEAMIAEAITSRRTAASTSWSHQPGASLDYRITVASAWTDRDSYYGVGRDPLAYGTSNNTLALVDAQVNHYAGAHTLSWGAQWQQDRTRDEQPGHGRSLNLRYTTRSLFAQHDWTFARGWQMLSGTRVDWHTALTRPIVSPRFALVASPHDTLDLRLSAARGFRAPQVFDEDLHLTAIGGDIRLVTIDPNLTEERATNLMAGAEWKPPVGPGQALIEVTAFHTRLSNLFHTVVEPDRLWKTNLGGATVEGLEVNLCWGIGDELVLQGGFVSQRARFDDAEPEFGSREFFRSPRHYGTFTARWRSHGGWEAFAGLRTTGRMYAPHYAGYIATSRLEHTPRFTTLDASIGRTFGHLTLLAAGKNLTNAYQRDLDRGPLRDPAYVYGPRTPRSFALTARLELQ